MEEVEMGKEKEMRRINPTFDGFDRSRSGERSVRSRASLAAVHEEEKEKEISLFVSQFKFIRASLGSIKSFLTQITCCSVCLFVASFNSSDWFVNIFV